MRGRTSIPLPHGAARRVRVAKGIAVVLVALGFSALAGLVAVPSPASALTPHAPIVINGNAEFTGANGVTGGSGTPSDPFILEGWEIDGSANSGIEVYNTDAHFVIRDVYVHSSLIDAIYFYSVQNGTVENATVSGNDGALYIQVSSYVTVTSSNISFNGLDAVVLDWSSNITVEGNEMWSNGDWGVFAYESDDLVIRNNTIANNGWIGIELSLSSDRVIVEGNSVTNNNIAGLALDTASNVTVRSNTFADNDYNVDLTNSNDVLIRNNTVATSTSDGITITGGARMTIAENDITGNGGGVLAVGATALRVYHNAFNGNLPQAADVNGANAWDDGYLSGGNWWSDYTGVDNCSGPNQDVCPVPDGIGDTPYVIDADSQDRYPLTNVTLKERGPIFIWGNGDFTAANGVVSGDGTPATPYIIEGWSINASRGAASAGILVGLTTAHFIIRNVSVHDGLFAAKDGIQLSWVANGRIENTFTANNVNGINVQGPPGNVTVANNTVYANWFRGITARQMVDLTLENNWITEHRLFAIQIVQSDFVLVRGNNATSNDLPGVDVELSTNVTVTGNRIAENGVDGIHLASSFDVLVHHNTFLNNGPPQAFDNFGPQNAFDDGYPSGGNFWSDYTGVDNCSGPNQDVCPDPDGIGDTPYVIDADSQDRYPLVSPPQNKAPLVTVVSPNGGEDWTGGSAHAVMWTMGDAEDATLTVAVELSIDGGVTFMPMFGGALPVGSATYTWALPSVDTTAALIRVCVIDSGGLSACDTSDGFFTIDSTRPVLIATQPSDGASDIDPSTEIVLTFSEPMNRSETEAAVAVAPAVPATASWDASSTVLTLRPTAPLADGTTYAVTIGCGAEDDSDPSNALAGCPRSFSFSSRIAASPPVVTIAAPSGGERWTGGTPHAITWTMSDTTTPGDLVADLDYSADGGSTWAAITTGLVRPQGLNVYTWIVPSIEATGVAVRVCASDGALTACSVSPAFAVDSTPPAVIATIPPEGAANVAVGQPLVTTFSEAIDTAAFPPTGVGILPPVIGLIVTWSLDLRTLTVAHSPFAPCTTYTATVDAARDGSDPGIPMPFAHSWSFSTVCPPTAAILAPLGGEDWTGGSTHFVRFRVTDEADAQVWAWLNATIDGTETALYAGRVAVGETVLAWTVPASIGTAMLRLEIVDSSGLTATAMTGEFVIDATPPTLLSTDPADGLSGVQVGAPLVLTFSERMNTVATESAIRITPPAAVLDFTWGAGLSVLIIRFSTPLAVNTSYVVAVGCEALDDSDPGNALAGCPAATTEFAFRTEPAPPVAAAVTDVEVRVGVPVTFDGRGSTGAIVRYTWTIRDALDSVVATLEGSVVTHTFAKAGTHSVTLQVTDMFGRTDEYRFDVTVQAVVGGDGSGWMLVLVGALATATILFTTSEPGRVALMTATFARAYGRRRKDEKDSELRGAMLYYVRVHPGDCYMDIKRNLDLNDGVVTYHLARLEKEGLIRSAIHGARRRYYPAEMRVPLENGGELHEIQQRILRFVGEAPGVPVAVLAEQLGVSNQLALYHLRKLSQGQRVELERAGLRLRAYPGRTEE